MVPADFCGNHWDAIDPVPAQGKHMMAFEMNNCSWRSINTSAGVYDWTRLDACVSAWGARPWIGNPWGTPTWASARPAEAHVYGLGAAAEPAVMADLGTYVTQLVNRYPTMSHIEVWNEPDVAAPMDPPLWYTGSVATFVTMCQTVYNAAKAARPGIVVLGPGTVNYLSSPNWLDAWFAAGGASYVDAYSIHGYQTQYGTPLKAFLGVAHQLQYLHNARSKNGIVNKDIYITEFGQTNPGGRYFTTEAYVTGYKRAMLFAAATGVKMASWYNHDGPTMGYNGRTDIEAEIAAFITLLSGATLTNVWLNVPSQTISATINGVDYEI